MDLTPDAIAKIVHPTAAFFDGSNSGTECPNDLKSESEEDLIPWNKSELNPKNRIDSLDQVQSPRWKIDGSSGMGTQFYTIPLFFKKLHPVRIDTFIPQQSAHSPRLRRLLEMDTAFHYKDSRVAQLGISRHVLRALEYWTASFPDFEATYEKLPFGSRIVFENLTIDIREIRIRIVQTHYLERQLLSPLALQTLWGIPASAWPENIDVLQVELFHQLHDSVSVVQIPGSHGSRSLILKALTSYPKYLYHELKVLLTMPPHPNIIGRPAHVVTKKCLFGGKTAVIGFTTEYHPRGTLRDILPQRTLHHDLRIADQVKWALQLTSALIHLQVNGRFYSDLRLDNILLSEEDDLIMVDFEQRGVWCEFAAPEVNYLDYVHMLAVDPDIPVGVRERYEKLLLRYFPDFGSTLGDDYDNPEHGYSIPWLCLSPEEQESAEVYMLGRVLWCIFEGLSSPEMAVWQSYRHESAQQFPTYLKTPLKWRKLIDECTKGRKEWGSGYDGGVVRRGNRLVLRLGDGTETTEEVQAEATRWWKRELMKAEDFLQQRAHRRELGQAGDVFGRPKLSEVREELERFQTALGLSCTDTMADLSAMYGSS